MRLLFAAALCSITAGTVYCQRGPAPYYEDTNNVPVSPEMHADRTVTFRLFAPKASEVVLMGSPGILEVIKKPMPLQRDDKGVWSLTVGPLAPGFYTYGYAIDGGLRMPDPSNPNLEVRRWGADQPLHRARRREGGHRRTARAARDGSRGVLRFRQSGHRTHGLRLHAAGLRVRQTEVSGSLSAARQRADRSILDLDRARQRDPGQPSRRREDQTDGGGDALRPRAAGDQDRRPTLPPRPTTRLRSRRSCSRR